MKNKILFFRILVTLIISFMFYYVSLPAINLSNPEFYSFLVLIVIIYLCTTIFNVANIRCFKFNNFKKTKNTIICIGIACGILVFMSLINIIYSPLFNSKMYYERIKIDEENVFTDDVKEVDFKSIPLLDRDSSEKLGDRVMGQMPELVSQFTVSSLYTQINYKGDIVRVTPLEYADLIKYFTNMKEGVKGYITVNSVNGQASLTKLDNGMKYMPSAILSKDLTRHVRFRYPTEIFDSYSFEIDEDGKPYWIIPTIKYTAIGLREQISGVITVDPVTGDTKKYEVGSIPQWIDHAYTASLILEQVDDWGKYKNGFFNSIFGQKGVVATTDGYNYLAMNDDIYLYTGITSAIADESNLGFILTNMRTGQTSFYSVPGAEEYSAMSSAEGQVQQMKYKSTFPLLINLNKRPTYLVSLKDNAGLVKMYGFVDVEDYQKVSVTDSSLGIDKAASNYINNVSLDNKGTKNESTIIIKEIFNVTINGNTTYFIVDTNNNKYKASILINENLLPFIKINDTVKITYNNISNTTEIKSIE